MNGPPSLDKSKLPNMNTNMSMPEFSVPSASANMPSNPLDGVSMPSNPSSMVGGLAGSAASPMSLLNGSPASRNLPDGLMGAGQQKLGGLSNLQMPNGVSMPTSAAQFQVPQHLNTSIPTINIDANSMNGSNFANQMAQFSLPSSTPAAAKSEAVMFTDDRHDDDTSDVGSDEEDDAKNKLQDLQAKAIFSLVEDISISTKTGNTDSKLLFLTNRQARQIDLDDLDKFMQAMDIHPKPKLVMNFMPSFASASRVQSKLNHWKYQEGKIGIEEAYDVGEKDLEGMEDTDRRIGVFLRETGETLLRTCSRQKQWYSK